ncbi:unnamed protein product, partial [Polarella glacialis]
VLPPDGKVKTPPQRLLDCVGHLGSDEETQRFWKAGGVVREGLLHRHRAEGLDEAHRILAAPHVFDVLLPEDVETLDEKQVRSAYRKLALRVHPDKQSESADIKAFQGAFARLGSSCESLEAMLAEDLEACRELCRVLRSEVHTRAGAAALLGVDKASTSDVEGAKSEAEKAAKQIVKKLAKMQVVAPDYSQAEAICDEAVKTMCRVCTPESLPRMESLMKE